MSAPGEGRSCEWRENRPIHLLVLSWPLLFRFALGAFSVALCPLLPAPSVRSSLCPASQPLSPAGCIHFSGTCGSLWSLGATKRSASTAFHPFSGSSFNFNVYRSSILTLDPSVSITCLRAKRFSKHSSCNRVLHYLPFRMPGF